MHNITLSKTSTKAERALTSLFISQNTGKLQRMKVANNKIIYQSDRLTIDPQSGEVNTDTEVIRFGPVNMKVLIALINQQGKVISRTELFDLVWPNQVVSDDVLTRCISDLRSQLGPHSESAKLIETIPKRGYRWLPEVIVADPNAFVEHQPEEVLGKSVNILETANNLSNNKEQVTGLKQNRLKYYLFWLAFGLFGLLVISTSFLWVVQKIVNTNLVRLALLPIQVTQQLDKPMAAELEDLLTSRLLDKKGLKFLARSAIANRPQNPFPYFAREFGTGWIIEGQIRPMQQKYRITLSLVDAKTATIFYSLTDDIHNTPEQLTGYCDLFVEKMVKQLDLTQ